jgi:hypothetical protein
VEDILVPMDDDGVTGVVAPLIAGNHVHSRG